MAVVSAQQPPPSDATVLSVSRVILYKTGIGYFEHLATVTGNQSIAVQFTGDQLDDVLKSLTAVDVAVGEFQHDRLLLIADGTRREVLERAMAPVFAKRAELYIEADIQQRRAEVTAITAGSGAGSSEHGRAHGLVHRTTTETARNVDTLGSPFSDV